MRQNSSLGRPDNSTLGGKPLTQEDRQRLAEYLYGDRQWTMEQIAKALSVTKMTVSNDL